MICPSGKSVLQFFAEAEAGRDPFGDKIPAPESLFREWLQIDARSQPRAPETFSSVFRKFVIVSALSRPDRRGVRVVTDVGRGAMDAELHHLTRDAAGGRQKRVVPIPRCWDQPLGLKSPGDGG